MTDREKLAYIAGRLSGLAQDWVRVTGTIGKELNELAQFALRQEK